MFSNGTLLGMKAIKRNKRHVSERKYRMLLFTGYKAVYIKIARETTTTVKETTASLVKTKQM